MSTAYPPRLVRYLFSSKKERNSARASAMTPGFFGTFSPIMGLYYTGPGTDFLSERFVLSAIDPHDKTTPKQDLHAVTFHKGPGILQMTLYSTTEHGSTPMVIATNNHRYGSSTDITLPAPINDAQKIERLQYGSIASNSYSFTLEGEVFRWRQDKAKSPKVMRLVRQATARVADDESTTLIEKSDQQEVVATWTEGSVPNRNARLAIFQCYSSDTIRQLGEYGTLLAVSSALVVCQRGAAIEGTMAWHEEDLLGKRHYDP